MSTINMYLRRISLPAIRYDPDSTTESATIFENCPVYYCKSTEFPPFQASLTHTIVASLFHLTQSNQRRAIILGNKIK